MRGIKFLLVSTGILLITSCQESSEVKKLNKLEIAFRKEGTLKLLKAENDSIVKTLDVEFAESEYETQTGLMYRDRMAENQGMLFIFSDERPRSFYMKNTRIPLDIIYLNSNQKIVSIVKNATPFDQTSLPSNGAAMYVLEINAGLADEWSLDVGDYISFEKLK